MASASIAQQHQYESTMRQLEREKQERQNLLRRMLILTGELDENEVHEEQMESHAMNFNQVAATAMPE